MATRRKSNAVKLINRNILASVNSCLYAGIQKPEQDDNARSTIQWQLTYGS